jgi:hypothetical protein
MALLMALVLFTLAIGILGYTAPKPHGWAALMLAVLALLFYLLLPGGLAR